MSRLPSQSVCCTNLVLDPFTRLLQSTSLSCELHVLGFRGLDGSVDLQHMGAVSGVAARRSTQSQVVGVPNCTRWNIADGVLIDVTRIIFRLDHVETSEAILTDREIPLSVSESTCWCSGGSRDEWSSILSCESGVSTELDSFLATNPDIDESVDRCGLDVTLESQDVNICDIVPNRELISASRSILLQLDIQRPMLLSTRSE
jgi:hypothetical protein